MIHPDPMDPTPIVEELRAVETLTPEEREQMEAIAIPMLASHKAVCGAMERRFEEWMDLVESQGMYRTADRGPYGEDMARLYDRRKAVSVVLVTALESFLTKERLETLFSYVAYEEFREKSGHIVWRAPG